MSQIEYVYGMHAVVRLLKTDSEHVETVMLDNKRRDERAREIETLAKSADILLKRVKPDAFPDAIKSAKHQGVVALVRATTTKTEQDLQTLLDRLDSPALLLVLDGVQDPHNLGACLRSADAAGAHAVIVPKDRACGITSVVRKVAAGAVETTPVIQVTNLVRCLKDLQQRGVWVYGTSMAASISYDQADFTGPVALVMGAEGEGMRRLTEETCDELVSIPMLGQVESLNVSVSSGICLYEVVRQRKKSV